jgi:hypothetical protein
MDGRNDQQVQIPTTTKIQGLQKVLDNTLECSCIVSKEKFCICNQALKLILIIKVQHQLKTTTIAFDLFTFCLLWCRYLKTP